MRPPPVNTDAELALLGACLLSSEAIATAGDTLRPEHFYHPAHGHIFDTILALYASGDQVDPVTVAADLDRRGLLETVGGFSGLIVIQTQTGALSNVPSYVRLVESAALMRRLISAGGHIAEIGYVAEDADMAIDQAERLVLDVSDHRRRRDSSVTAGVAVEAAVTRLELLFDSDETITGVPTGFLDLDDLLGGLQPDSLVIIGARPSMGKSALALGIASHVAIAQKRPVALFSLEMSQAEIAQRLLSSEARVDSQRIRHGRLSQSDWEKLAHVRPVLADAPLIIDDDPNVSVMGVRSRARKIRHEHKDLGLVIVDYLQLMAGGAGENETLRLGEISRGLKILARELGVPVVALSQLNRGLEQRADKRPILSDLRQSGSLEQDADVVMFVYRDEVYNPESSDAGIAEISVQKHRAGPNGLIRLAWLGQYTRFANMARN